MELAVVLLELKFYVRVTRQVDRVGDLKVCVLRTRAQKVRIEQTEAVSYSSRLDACNCESTRRNACTDYPVVVVTSVVVDGPASPGDKLMKVPEKLLVPKHGMNISLKNSDFIFEPDDSVLSSVQIDIADRMIEIYNMTNKVE